MKIMNWDERYKNIEKLVEYDGWLDEYKKYFESGMKLLEIGVGTGPNLCEYSVLRESDIYASDISENAVKIASKRIPGINYIVHNSENRFDFVDNYFDLIISDLSLHYFSLETTSSILRELSRILRPNGKIILRVNSVDDTNHGYGVGKELEKDTFLSNGQIKRYFTEDSLQTQFFGWNCLSIKKDITLKYKKKKHVIVAIFTNYRGLS